MGGGGGGDDIIGGGGSGGDPLGGGSGGGDDTIGGGGNGPLSPFPGPAGRSDGNSTRPSDAGDAKAKGSKPGNQKPDRSGKGKLADEPPKIEPKKPPPKQVPPMAELRQPVNGSTPSGLVLVGNPKKAVNVIMDTGSDVLVLKSWSSFLTLVDKVDSGASSYVHSSGVLYNSNESSSYHPSFITEHGEKAPKRSFIKYGSGMAVTLDGSDTVQLTDKHGVEGAVAVKKAAVGASSLGNALKSTLNIFDKDIKASSSSEVQDFPVSEIMSDSLKIMHSGDSINGILGLQHMKNSSMGESLFTRMRNTGAMTSFGYCRDEKNNSGTFIWNDAAKDGFENKVIGQIHWAVKLANVKMNTSNDSFCEDGNCASILDTGSNIIAGPVAPLRSLTRTMKIKRDCSNFNSLPEMQVQLGNLTASIPPEAYVIQVEVPVLRGRWGNIFGGGSAIQQGDQQSKGEDWAALRAASALQREGDYATHEDLSVHLRLHQEAMEAKRLGKGHPLFSLEMMKVCIPAVVPLDHTTDYGPLWVVGTPLFANYYARWSWPQHTPQPVVHLESVTKAQACKGTPAAVVAPKANHPKPLDKPPSGPPLAKTPQKAQNTSVKKPEPRKPEPKKDVKGAKGGAGLLRQETAPDVELVPEPTLRSLEEIRVPHWAGRLVEL